MQGCLISYSNGKLLMYNALGDDSHYTTRLQSAFKFSVAKNLRRKVDKDILVEIWGHQVAQ